MKTRNNNKYDTIILDMDGTILDSRGTGKIKYEWAYEALRKTLLHYKINLTVEEMDSLFLGPLYKRKSEGLKDFCNSFNIKYDEFWRLREENTIKAKIEEMEKGGIKLFGGAKMIIKYLSLKGYVLALVSDSQQECVDFVMRFFRLNNLFKLWYGRSSALGELKRIKPNPYYINKVLKELNTSSAILVDDSPVGILAANSSGIDSMFLCNEESEYEVSEEIKQQATYSIKDIREVKDVL